jgi:Tfp pilus assembly protein PilE
MTRPFKHRAMGMTLLEVSAGAALLAVLLGLLAQMFVQVRQHSRRAEDRAAMLRVVENLLEECTAAPWAAINDDALAALELPDEAVRHWPEARLIGRVAASTDGAESKQVTLTLSPGPKSRDRSVSLTAWIFKASEN